MRFLPFCEQQLDIAFDVYQKQSRKRETWEGFDKKDGVRLSIKKKTATYTKFAKVLKFDDYKTELSNLIVKALSGLFRNQKKILLITRQQTVLSNQEVLTRRKQLTESSCMP